MPTSSSRTERPFLQAVRAGALVVDGAMGTQLYERGILYGTCFDELNASRPELVAKVHEDFLRAGAQVIETNTFGANALRLEKYGLASRVRELNTAGVRIARAAAGSQAYVLGAIGPSGYFLGGGGAGAGSAGSAGEMGVDDLAKVKAVLLEQARALVEAKVDAIVVETFRQDPRAARVAVEAAVEAAEGRIPVIASASLDDSGRMAEGTEADEIARLAREWVASVVGVNCSDGPMGVLAAVTKMIPVGLPVLASPNAGQPRRVDERTVYVSTPEYFGVYARRMIRVGVRLVGGCCGTTRPSTSGRSARRGGADGRGDGRGRDAGGRRRPSLTDGSIGVPERSSRAALQTPMAARGAELSRRAKVARGRFVVSVEVNPPVGLDPSRAIAAARSLKAGGVDVVNIADGARAQARMSNIALAVRIQSEVSIETILHVCGRDRNLLGTLAHLLGAHDLGVRNLVVITGDPPKMGDFPGRDGGLRRISTRFGILALATAPEPRRRPGRQDARGDDGVPARDRGGAGSPQLSERELARLADKKAAGAADGDDPAGLLARRARPVPRRRRAPRAAGARRPVAAGELPERRVPAQRGPRDAGARRPIRERMRKAGSGPAAQQGGRRDRERDPRRGAWPGRGGLRDASVRAARAGARGARRLPGSGTGTSMKRSAALEVATLLGVAALGACRRAPVDAAGGPEASSEGPQDDGGRACRRRRQLFTPRARPDARSPLPLALGLPARRLLRSTRDARRTSRSWDAARGAAGGYADRARPPHAGPGRVAASPRRSCRRTPARRRRDA